VIEILLVSPEEALGLVKDTTLKFDAKAWLVVSRFAESATTRKAGGLNFQP
jgi:hypothetical protein